MFHISLLSTGLRSRLRSGFSGSVSFFRWISRLLKLCRGVRRSRGLCGSDISDMGSLFLAHVVFIVGFLSGLVRFDRSLYFLCSLTVLRLGRI